MYVICRVNDENARTLDPMIQMRSGFRCHSHCCEEYSEKEKKVFR